MITEFVKMDRSPRFDVVFIDEIPKTSVGKFDKKILRDRYHGHEPNAL